MSKLWTFLDALVLWLHDRSVPVRKLFVVVMATTLVCALAQGSGWGAHYDVGFWANAGVLGLMFGWMISMAATFPVAMWNGLVLNNRRGILLVVFSTGLVLDFMISVRDNDWRRWVVFGANLLFTLVLWSRLPTKPPRPRRRTSLATKLAWSRS